MGGWGIFGVWRFFSRVASSERVESTLNGRLRLTVLRVYRFVSVVSNVFLITTEKARIELLSPNCN